MHPSEVTIVMTRYTGSRIGLARNIPFFYIYTFLNSFYLDRGIWVLFLLDRGFSLTEVGLLEALYHVAAFVFEVPTGYVADRFGKKASLLCGQGLKIAGVLLLVLGSGEAALYTGFMVMAVAGTFLSGATGAWVYETMKQSGQESGFKRLNSRLYAVMLISLGLASPVGGFLSQIHWDILYLCVAVLCGLSMLVLLFLQDTGTAADDQAYSMQQHNTAALVEKEPAAAMPHTGFIEQLRLSASVIRRHQGLRWLIIYGALLYAVTTSAGFYVQMLLEQGGMSKSLIGTFNGIDMWIGAAVGAAAYWAERRLSRKGLLALCSFGCMAAVWGLGFGGGVSWLVLVTYISMNSLINLLEPMIEAYLNEYLPSAQRATLLSFYSMMISISMVVVFFSASWLADHTGIRTALVIVAAVWLPVQVWSTVQAVRLSPAGHSNS